MDFGLAREVEEFGDLARYGGHDRGVEECVETGEQKRTDYDCDKNLDTRVYLALAASVGDNGLGAYYHRVELVGDGVDDLFHKINTSFSFC